ncbi:hypothetical protein FIBSPDRAFT_966125 [Athelia psychrophila]|uniref:Uncharacterized protein n=1 Tax=Athelia psychrophila TaxID=1759441 RepID=A0A167X4R8_9AGAM|nr:hypothetical protein FIBSPDRAFT_966125 [Fibularhizoctonia sp. CBS 109695]
MAPLPRLLPVDPVALSDIVRHDRIERGVSLVDKATPLKEEYTPSKANGDLWRWWVVMKHGDGVCFLHAELKACSRRANESPALDGIRAEIVYGEMVIVLCTFAGPASSPSSVLGCHSLF